MWQGASPELDASMRRYIAVILDLLERPAPAANEAGNELTPPALELSAGAKAVWIASHDRIEAEMAQDGSFECLRDVAGKAAENAARIAAVLTIVENPGASTVEAEAMVAGSNLIAWYLSEAQRLSGMNRTSPRVRNAIKLLDWLRTKRKTEITRSEIMRLAPSPVRQKTDADNALAILEEHGWVAPVTGSKPAKWDVIQEAAQ